MANENQNIIGAGQDTARRAPKTNTITCGDCLEVMQGIPDKSVDMILCDLPYGNTQNKWDVVIPLVPLWDLYVRVCRGAIVLMASQPFTSILIYSNMKMFKYEWFWIKEKGKGQLNSKKQPLRSVENICVFYKEQPTYNPQFKIGIPYIKKNCNKNKLNKGSYGSLNENHTTISDGRRYPTTDLYFTSVQRTVHPTQKPVFLLEYLIKTYTNKEDTVLDNCIGSGTTAIACINTGRNYIGIEKEEKYCRIAEERIHALRSPAQNAMEICHTAPNS